MFVLCFDWIKSSGNTVVFFPTVWFDIGSVSTVLWVEEMGRMKEFVELVWKFAVKNHNFTVILKHVAKQHCTCKFVTCVAFKERFIKFADNVLLSRLVLL